MKSTTSAPTGDVPAPTVRAILRAVRDAEVLLISFPRLQRALVVDHRPDDGDEPPSRVTVVILGSGGQAAAIETLSAGQPPSARTIMATWGGSTRAFMEQGVLPAILNRLPAGFEKQAMTAFEELRIAERSPDPTVGKPRLTSGG